MDKIDRKILKRKRDFNTLILTTNLEDLNELLTLEKEYRERKIEIDSVVLHRIYEKMTNEISDSKTSTDFIKSLKRCDEKIINYLNDIITISFSDFGNIDHEFKVTTDILEHIDYKIINFWSHDSIIMREITNKHKL